MKLGVLCSHPIQYVSPLLRELARRCELHVYYGHRQTPEQQGAAGFGVPFDWDVDLLSGYRHSVLENVARAPGVGSFFACDTPGIAEEVSRQRFDAFVVLGWHLKCYWQANRACRRYGVPVLVRGDSQLRTPRSPTKRLVKEATHRWIMRQFDGYLYVGKRNREYLLHYGADPRRLFFAPHFVDNSWFRDRAAAAAPHRTALRHKLGIPDGAKVLLFVGKLLPFKRPQDILRACTERVLRDRDCQVLFVGSGPLQETLRDEAELRGVRATFAGFRNQSELPAFYDVADALILPSEQETWGLVVNEAMACGTPAIVSGAVGCAPDLIVPGATGAVFPVGDTQRLADAIRAMLGRKADAAVQKALASKIACYSIDAAVEGTLSAINRVRGMA